LGPIWARSADVCSHVSTEMVFGPCRRGGPYLQCARPPPHSSIGVQHRLLDAQLKLPRLVRLLVLIMAQARMTIKEDYNYAILASHQTHHTIWRTNRPTSKPTDVSPVAIYGLTSNQHPASWLWSVSNSDAPQQDYTSQHRPRLRVLTLRDEDIESFSSTDTPLRPVSCRPPANTKLKINRDCS
jgi:hypothetical protein